MKALPSTTRSKAAPRSARSGAGWGERSTNGMRSGKRSRLAADRRAHFLECPIEAALDGGELLSGDFRDLREGQIPAEAQGDGVPLLRGGALGGGNDHLTVLRGVEVAPRRPRRGRSGRGGPLQSPLLRALAADVVAQEVQRDGVEPRLLAALAGIEAAPGLEHPLEGVGEQILSLHA